MGDFWCLIRVKDARVVCLYEQKVCIYRYIGRKCIKEIFSFWYLIRLSRKDLTAGL